MNRSTAVATVFAVALSLAHAQPALALGAADACTWKGNFIAAGATVVARAGHVATTLADGSVLITGGSSRTTALRTAERFDATQGTFTALPAMTVERYFHTATRLESGKVLIAGGSSGALSLGITPSAELFDPAGNAFTATGSMATPRLFHTATALSDGTILIVGGTTTNGARVAEAELFDPATGQFRVVARLAVPRTNHTAVHLGSPSAGTDEVMIVGGSDANGVTPSVEIFAYDKASRTGSFRAAPPLSEARQDHTAVRLQSGAVVVIGGSNAANRGVATAERWDGGGFWPVGPMNHPRRNHMAILLPTGQVLVAGGLDLRAVAPAEIYTPGYGFQDIGDLTSARFYAAAALLGSGQVLFSGGFDASETTILGQAELYDPFWSGVGPMHEGRSDHTATLLADGRVLLAGGRDGAGGSRNTAEIFDPATQAFTVTAMNGSRALHTATLLAGGEVLVAGGETATGTFLSTAELFDPGTGRFSPTASIASPRLGHAAALLADGRVLVSGGFGPDPWSSTELFSWNASNRTGAFTAGPPMTRDRHHHAAVRLDNGHVLVSGGWSDSVSGITYAIEDLDPAGGFSLLPNAAWMVTNRRDHTMAAIPGEARGLVAGGLTSGNTPTASFETIPQGSQGRMSSPRFLHALTPVASSPTVFWAIGGLAAYAGSPLASAEALDAARPATTIAVPPLGAGRARHTATLLTDGRVLVAGGRRDMDSTTATAEISKTTRCTPTQGFWKGKRPVFEKFVIRPGPRSFAVRGLIATEGRTSSPAFDLQYMLVSKHDAEQRIVVGVRRTPALGAGKKAWLSSRFELPARLAAGRYTVRACVTPQRELAGQCFDIPGEIVQPGRVPPDRFPHAAAPKE